ncbi:hypothetical protein SAMD00023353_1100810 [Rosellinia necatrix]|uniref:Uncharacterized protein n=1 Tax=Rosellinia necatrix TaxID=77044 RepID=A0A1S8A7H8_ROSNE|nr:hypothetical protein SAMD00023353_1100810 [Rosellinia necatrix]
MVFCINDRLRVYIVLARLDSLDHPHENPRQGKSCGQLRAALRSFVLMQPGETEASPFNTLTRPNDLEAPVNGEPLTPLLVPEFRLMDSSENVDWENPRNAHDMIPPHTEWRISIIGVANIYISVERIFFDECDSENDPDDDDAPHRFLDAVDIVINSYMGNDGITNGE